MHLLTWPGRVYAAWFRLSGEAPGISEWLKIIKGSDIGAFFTGKDRTQRMRSSRTQLVDLLEPVVTGLGYELVEVEFVPNPKHGVLRIYIDQPEGIGLDDCERVSQQVSALLDVEDPIPGHYDLEVSSPGLDRPLRSAADFTRFTGEIARIRLGMPIDGQRNFKGRLAGVDGDAVRLDCENGQFALPLASIEKARLVPDFDTKK